MKSKKNKKHKKIRQYRNKDKSTSKIKEDRNKNETPETRRQGKEYNPYRQSMPEKKDDTKNCKEETSARKPHTKRTYNTT